MSGETNYDDLLNIILLKEGSISGFFDRIFDFLNRNTDYFKINTQSYETGFTHRDSEAVLRSVFSKYVERALSEQPPYIGNDPNIPIDYACEEVVSTSEELAAKPNKTETDCAENSGIDDKVSSRIAWMDPDCFNGAQYEGYSWAQTLYDIDLRIKVPENVIHGKQLRVSIQQDKICVKVQSDVSWNVVKEGVLSWKINVEESTWTLVPKEHIHVYLLKLKERWWDSLFEDEPKIDLKAIDATINYEDLDIESQAKIKELMFNQQQKMLGKPTIEERVMHNKLKEAWNAEGSPFKDHPFDPSLIEFQNVRR